MHDFCLIKRIDHLEFFVGSARQAAVFYETCFGFHRTAYRGLETDSRDAASYLLEQGDIRFMLTTPLGQDHSTAQFIRQHDDGVGVIALEVSDAAAAFRETTSRGAEPAMAPEESRDEKGALRTSAIHLYGDTIMKFVERDDYVGTFAPGFRPVSRGSSSGDSTALTAGGVLNV